MFTEEKLRQDSVFISAITRLCHDEFSSGIVGKYKEKTTPDEAIKRVANGKYSLVKYLPKSGYTLYKTSDIGVGYMSDVSTGELLRLQTSGLIDPSELIVFKYKHCNIFPQMTLSEDKLKSLETNETYLVIDEKASLVVTVNIGKMFRPNHMYYREDLHMKTGTLQELIRLPGFNRVEILCA